MKCTIAEAVCLGIILGGSLENRVYTATYWGVGGREFPVSIGPRGFIAVHHGHKNGMLDTLATLDRNGTG